MIPKCACLLLGLFLVVCPHRLLAADPRTLQIADAQVMLATDVSVPAQVAGAMEAFRCQEGDVVAAGEVLAVLNDELAQRQLAAAEQQLRIAILESEGDFELRYAEKTLAVHQQERERSEAANRRFPGSVTDSDLRRLELMSEQSRLRIEQADRDRKIAEARVAEKRSELASAKLQLARHQIKAPVSGLIIKRFVDEGEWVDIGTPVVQVVDLDVLRIECFVKGEFHDISLADAEVVFVPRAPSRATPVSEQASFAGVVEFVSPEISPVTGQIRLRARVKNQGGKLKPGMRGELQINLPVDDSTEESS